MRIPGTNAGSGSISRLRLRFADREPKIPGSGHSNASDGQNSNRECIRLETAVNRRKPGPGSMIQPGEITTGVTSNRELEALFSAANARPRRNSRAGTPTAALRFLRTRRRGRSKPSAPRRRTATTTANSTATAGEKSKSQPLESVSGRREADCLFCLSYKRF